MLKEYYYICTKLTSNEIFSLAVNSQCVYREFVVGWENLFKAVVMNEVYSN